MVMNRERNARVQLEDSVSFTLRGSNCRGDTDVLLDTRHGRRFRRSF